MTGVSRSVAFLALLTAVGAAATGCSETVSGAGSLGAGALAPAPVTSPSTPAASTASAPTSTPVPAPRRRDPIKTADQVNVRASDLPGWSKVPGSSAGGDDSFNWVVICARDAGVPGGTFSGAQTPDFSPSGTVTTSQVGSATGLFDSDAAAHRFVALFRSPVFGRCVGAEANRRWGDVISGAMPAFTPGTVRVPTATEAAGIGARVTFTGGRPAQLQFIPIRTGPIVTVLSTLWRPAADSRLLARAAANIGTRQRTASAVPTARRWPGTP